MPRNSICRSVCMEPQNKLFKTEADSGQLVVLSIEEVEALRLCDYECLEQEDGAQNMGVSRGTFQRILYSARKKTASALAFGHSILIEGGNYTINGCKCNCPNRCKQCTFNKGENSKNE